MRKTSKVPAPPCPNVVNKSHCEIELDWRESADKLSEAFPNEKVASELIMLNNKFSDKNGKRIYIGYASNFTVMNLEPKKSYTFCLRFKIEDNWCPYSEPLTVDTEEHPVTGEDIHKAVRGNNTDILETLLIKNPKSVDIQDSLGFTPLMVAAQRSQIEIMKVLQNNGADLEARTASGKTALMLASFKGEYDAMEYLLDTNLVDINGRDKAGMSALHYAVDGENGKAIRILIIRGADVNIVDKVLLWSPLMRCAGLKSNGKVDIAQELIKYDADLNLQDKEGNTTLFMACLNNHLELCELLLKKNADIEIPNKRNITVKSYISQTDNIRLKDIFFNEDSD